MTTAADIINLAMKNAGVLGVGQTLLSEDMNDAFRLLNMMIAQWATKRWLIWHNVDKSVVSTGAQSYTIGPGGNINVTVRPGMLEAAYLRLLAGPAASMAVDFPLKLIFSMEDYSRITLKTLGTFSNSIFYDKGNTLGVLYPWPIPQASLYEIHVIVKDVLSTFSQITSNFAFPAEYEAALHYNLSRRLRQAYRLPVDPDLNDLATESLQTIRDANAQIAQLIMPDNLIRPGIYNIYSDQMR